MSLMIGMAPEISHNHTGIASDQLEGARSLYLPGGRLFFGKGNSNTQKDYCPEIKQG